MAPAHPSARFVLQAESRQGRRGHPQGDSGQLVVKQLLKSTVLAPWVVQRGLGGSGRVALTFDDGPDPEYTERILEVFRRVGGRATFFLVGAQAEIHPDLVARIVADGHEIGNHSYSHPFLAGMGYAALRREILLCERTLARGDWAPAFNGLYRPPRGTLTWAGLMFAAFNRRKHVLWSIDPRDYRATSEAEIIEHVRRQRCRGGDIVLLHDNNVHTVGAVEPLLQEIAARELQPVTLSELIGAPEPGTRSARAVGAVRT